MAFLPDRMGAYGGATAQRLVREGTTFGAYLGAPDARIRSTGHDFYGFSASMWMLGDPTQGHWRRFEHAQGLYPALGAALFSQLPGRAVMRVS